MPNAAVMCALPYARMLKSKFNEKSPQDSALEPWELESEKHCFMSPDSRENRPRKVVYGVASDVREQLECLRRRAGIDWGEA